MSELTVGSLASGIGGIDLGLERAGMTVRWQSEIDPYACRVLAKHWPNVPNLGDIKTIDWSTVERVDLICGGYPCQPFSLAGLRQGESDPRNLWPYFVAAIRHLRPRWVLLENVPGHLSMGFGRVLGDLAACGYDCEWDCIPAAAVGAPHLRYRVIIVAHLADAEVLPERTGLRPSRAARLGRGRSRHGRRSIAVADAGRVRRVRVGRPESPRLQSARWRVAHRRSQLRQLVDTAGRNHWTTQSRLGGVVDGLSAGVERGWWDVEPDVGRVATGVANRLDRLRCLGNSVVPQVAEWVGRRIVAAS